MRIDVDTILTNLEDKPLQDITGQQGPDGIPLTRDLTLAMVLEGALLNLSDEDRNISGQEKARRFALAVKIHNANHKPLELGIEDLVTLKELVGKLYTPMVVGRVFEILDPAEIKG